MAESIDDLHLMAEVQHLVPEQVVVCVPRYLMFVEQAADDDLLQHFKSKAPWVRGPAARMSSSFTAPFNFKVALCLGHADRRSAHPGRAPSPRTTAQIVAPESDQVFQPGLQA